MDGERFDGIVMRLAASAHRRRALGLLAGAVVAGAVGRRSAAAQAVGTDVCRQRLGRCGRRGQCCEAAGDHPVACARLSEGCGRADRYPGDRCCGQEGAVCSDSCGCCRGFVCRAGACEAIDGACARNVCCGCYRCDEFGIRCRFVRCLTAASFRQCVEECGDVDEVRGIGGRNTTFACGANGQCKVVCGGEGGGPQPAFVHRTPTAR